MAGTAVDRRQVLAGLVGAVPLLTARPLSVWAQPLPTVLVPERSAEVVSVIDGDTVTLDSGDQVRLVGMQAPKLPLGRPDFEPWPLAEAARGALAALVLGRTVSLAHGGRRRDRNDRWLAHLVDVETGAWVQGAMLRDGWARVYTFIDNRAAVPEMLAEERAARAALRGIWADPYYRVRSALDDRWTFDRYELVEGVVVDAARVRGRVYLNFGTNWRDDFTVAIAPEDVARFRRSGLDPLSLEGRAIRVRGWLYPRNGPMIDADHPEQIEILDPD